MAVRLNLFLLTLFVMGIFLVSAAPEGSNVCTKVINYTEVVNEKKTQPFIVIRVEWCWESIRCEREYIENRTVNIPQVDLFFIHF